MNNTQKTAALAIAGAFALSVSATTVTAAENPFSAQTLSAGYQVADNHAEKGADGKCGEGKCGAEKAKKMKDGKCGEGKCGAEKAKKMKDVKCCEGKCGADKKAKEMKDGSCGAEGKTKDGKCGH
jgi:uncharacterized low-complexity protein